MKKQNLKLRLGLVVFLALFVGLISYPRALSFFPPAYEYLNGIKINLGLDLQGGIHLEYKADLSGVEEDKKDEALQAAQDVIERRINAFGVGEPLIQTLYSGGENRIIVELPGIKNINDAKNQIKETPFLEFKEEKNEEDLKEIQPLIDNLNESAKAQAQKLLEKAKSGDDFSDLAKEFSQDPGSKDAGGDLGFVEKGLFVPEFDQILFESELGDGKIYPELVESQFGWHIIKKIEEKTTKEEGQETEKREVHSAHILIVKRRAEDFPMLMYKSSGLSGKNLKDAQVVFRDQGLSEPQVSLKFDKEGGDLFAEITKRNIGKTVAIYLDDEIISAPVVQSEIANGEAVITGNFTIEEAKELKSRLNEGALPVPISLVSQQSVEASLGAESLAKSLQAGLVGLILVMVFMITYYRLLGLVAAIALLIYAGMMVTIFKLSGELSNWPITLTLSGIAGFILSVGMAVDANVLIFERIEEELNAGRELKDAINEGFLRAWSSIRDGNYSTIITSFILIWFGTGFVKGFAVILVIGVVLSMFTAIVLVKIILQSLAGKWLSKNTWLVCSPKRKK
ncbi:MAG: protein translocase subunit SecD [Candidatus Moranbacteria bacterium]|nr:protein translocase subunit SecD [Candidatus Moranbacteria bacterium]